MPITNLGLEYYYNKSIDRGIVVNVNAIDPQGLMSLSPYTSPGANRYFGVTEETKDPTTGEKKYVTSKSPLVRPDDFNAFLWYVMHKAKRQNPLRINIQNRKFTVNGKTYTLLNKDNLRGVTIITCTDGNGYANSGLPLGTILYDTSGTLTHPSIAIVYSNEKNDYGFNNINTVLEISSDWVSCNWYVDKSNYFSDNIGLKKNITRDFKKDRGICNVSYVTI